MTFLELSSSSRASQEDNFRDDCFTPGDRVDIVTEFHRKAEDNIPMVRLRAPAAVRADQDQVPGLGADVCKHEYTAPVPASEPADCSQKPFGTSSHWIYIYISTLPMFTYLLRLDENKEIRQLVLIFTCPSMSCHPYMCKIGS